MMRYRKLRKTNEKAQGLVEFALILPILLLLIIGIVEFGRFLFFYSSVTSASREAARYGAAVGEVGDVNRYADCDGIRNAARRAGTFANLEDGDITIEYDRGMTPTIASCPPSVPINLADRIVVSVSKEFQPIVAFVNIPFNFPVNSTTARTIIKEVGVKGTPMPTELPPGSNTSTPTASASPTPTDTPTPTATNTPTATDENTPTATSTGTVEATATTAPTPTNTPVPICGLEFRNFQQPSSKKITWDLYNNPNPGVLPVTILSLQLDFPTSKLSQVDFGGVTIWNGPPASSIATINTTDWDGTAADRFLGVGQEKTFTLHFLNNMPATGYTILIVTDNCLDPVSGSR